MVEIICCSPDDCVAAESGGASRIELCSTIELGGLTPSLGTLRRSLAATILPVVAMVRPRSGGFLYEAGEFEAMLADVEVFRSEGASGVVFGILTPERKIDVARCRTMVERAGPLECVFHRAFDVVDDPFEALETLIDLGVRRVLTSGGRQTAMEGAEKILALIEQTNGRIEILPGGGIREANVAELLKATGASQVHMSAFEDRPDPSMSGAQIEFNGCAVREDGYRAVDSRKVAGIVERLRRAYT